VREPLRGLKTKLAKVPWGRVLHSAQLAPAEAALDPPDPLAARALLEAHTTQR
jgi:hypothetical protein